MKRYRDYNTYLRDIFGERVQKISLDAGFSCPNRDGTLSETGCIYCNARGSGTGAMIHDGLSIDEQIERGRKFAGKRYGAKKYIAYFQSFTNTYGPVEKLRQLYGKALSHSGMVGLSVATRADCVDGPVLELIQSYQKDYLVWIEYGLQSAHDATLSMINRGHDVACFDRAVYQTAQYGINMCVHVILGLPGEDHDMMMETASHVSRLPIQGIKIHLLYVVKGTKLAGLYEKGAFRCLERDEYADLVVDFLEILDPSTVVQRLTGEPSGGELVAPSWAGEKTRNLQLIQSRLEERNTWQGRFFPNPQHPGKVEDSCCPPRGEPLPAHREE